MQHPKVKFDLNRELDFKVAKEFLEYKIGGIDFGKEGILKIHPKLKKIDTNSDSELRSYITNFYNKKEKLLKKTLESFEKRWLSLEEKFFKECNKIFSNLSWEKGRYTAYISIFNCGPRFLEDKTFQIFYKGGEKSNFSIAHEMLHFQFYNYYQKKLPEYKNKDKNKIWELSEIFNSLVMWQNENWKEISHPVKFHTYPKQEKIVKKLKPKWKNNRSIEALFDIYFR